VNYVTFLQRKKAKYEEDGDEEPVDSDGAESD